MFGKLMKYELRYLIRIFGPMWAVVVCLSVIGKVSFNPYNGGIETAPVGDAAFWPVIFMSVAFTGVIVMLAISVVILIQRFYKGMFGDEGYLMFTLPVTTGNLIHAKALSALLMISGSMVITVLCYSILLFYPEIWDIVREAFLLVIGGPNASAAQIAAVSIWGVIASVVTCAKGLYMLYFSITAGQLWKKHPVAGAIVVYYLISVALSALSLLVANYMGGFITVRVMDVLNSMNIGPVAYTTYVFLVEIIRAAVQIVVFYFGTKYLMEKKLNIA